MIKGTKEDMAYSYYGMNADPKKVQQETFQAIKRITLGI